MWGECSDEVVGEGVYVSSEGHRFPASGVLAETEAVLAATERRKTGDGLVFVGVDVQMASLGTDADMFVVSKGVNSITQLLRLLVGRLLIEERLRVSYDTFRKLFRTRCQIVADSR